MQFLQNIKLVFVCIAISTALSVTVSEMLGIMWSLGYLAGFLLYTVYHADRDSISLPVSFAITPNTTSEAIVSLMDKLFQLDK